MRLLKHDEAGRIVLTEDLPDSQRPKYAILSHTWSSAGPQDEVSLDDMVNRVGFKKPGYDKIRFCARRAKQDGLDYFWVDTCCINKESTAELSKSLISMFRWYAEAERCYVYLSDVELTPSENDEKKGWEDGFRVSRWFKRGWTLQELIAPSMVEFFSKEGHSLGTKNSLERHLREITRIPIQALRGQALSTFTVQERLRWQEGRESKEPEDYAYSLLGMFDISMAVLYGEGKARARERLLNEIEAAQKGIQHKNFSVTFSLSEVAETEHFIAREAELYEIWETLRSDGKRRCVVLQGLGGMGKTQLAIAYALRHIHDYSAVFWLNAADRDTVKSSFGRMAKQILRDSAVKLTISDPQEDMNKTVEAVKTWLSLPMNNRWLLIYDNHDNPVIPGVSDPAALDLHSYLPEAYQGSIIITTRSTVVQMGHCMRIQKMDSVQDSLEILKNSSGRGDLINNAGAKRLVEKLDGLPLALATAGAYLRQNALSFAEYSESLDQSWARIQELSPELPTYERRLFSTWQISFEQVRRRNPVSANLLRWWAYFDNRDLWFELLNHYAEGEPEWMRELTQDRLTFRATLQILFQHGLVELTSDLDLEVESQGYSVHACVHSWMLAVLNAQEDKILKSSALRRVASHVPDVGLPNSPLVRRRLLNHANRCMAYVHDSCDEYGDDEADLCYQYQRLGTLYTWHEKSAEARKLYERAIKGFEKVLGPDHNSSLPAVYGLAVLLSKQPESALEAEKMYKRALRGFEKASGPDHRSSLRAVHGLGILYAKHPDRIVEAGEMLRRASRGFEKLLGPDHLFSLRAVHSLGVLYAKQPESLAEIEEMLKRASEGLKKVLGPDHTSTLRAIHGLGVLYARQPERVAEAEEMYKRALGGFEKAVGPVHTSTLRAVLDLGLLYASQPDKLAEAKEIYERCRANFDRIPSDLQRWVDHLGGKLSALRNKTEHLHSGSEITDHLSNEESSSAD